MQGKSGRLFSKCFGLATFPESAPFALAARTRTPKSADIRDGSGHAMIGR